MRVDPRDLRVGQVVRHEEERKVVQAIWKNANGAWIVRFVDHSVSVNGQGIELNGRP